MSYLDLQVFKKTFRKNLLRIVGTYSGLSSYFKLFKIKPTSVIPLFGTCQKKHFEENVGALNVSLTEEEVQQIREYAEKADVKGERMPPFVRAMSYRDTI